MPSNRMDVGRPAACLVANLPRELLRAVTDMLPITDAARWSTTCQAGRQAVADSFGPPLDPPSAAAGARAQRRQIAADIALRPRAEHADWRAAAAQRSDGFGRAGGAPVTWQEACDRIADLRLLQDRYPYLVRLGPRHAARQRRRIGEIDEMLGTHAADRLPAENRWPFEHFLRSLVEIDWEMENEAGLRAGEWPPPVDMDAAHVGHGGAFGYAATMTAAHLSHGGGFGLIAAMVAPHLAVALQDNL